MKRMKNKNRKGFTLIELLIVIAIIAVLAVVVILSLNPAELLRKARDSNRLSDMATMKSAISLYLADVASPSMGTNGICNISITSGTFYEPNATSGAFTEAGATSCVLWMITATGNASTTNPVSRVITGTGWIPINFSTISSGAPIGQEPVDPVNQLGSASCAATALSSCGLFYSYIPRGTNYKLASFMESLKYATGTTGVEINDGGNSNFVYEGGTSPTL